MKSAVLNFIQNQENRIHFTRIYILMVFLGRLLNVPKVRPPILLCCQKMTEIDVGGMAVSTNKP